MSSISQYVGSVQGNGNVVRQNVSSQQGTGSVVRQFIGSQHANVIRQSFGGGSFETCLDTDTTGLYFELSGNGIKMTDEQGNSLEDNLSFEIKVTDKNGKQITCTPHFQIKNLESLTTLNISTVNSDLHVTTEMPIDNLVMKNMNGHNIAKNATTVHKMTNQNGDNIGKTPRTTVNYF